METSCLAHPKNAGCFILPPSNNAGAIVIARSVGAGGVNAAADVRKIQAALNDVPSGKGGPNPALAVDGICGPLTTRAIKRFQETHVSIVDSRIDPNGPTLAALNAESGSSEVPVVAAGLKSVTAPQAPRKPEYLPPDPAINTMVINLLGRVRDVIRAANFRLLTADPFVTNHKLTPPAGPFQESARESIRILNAAFSLDKVSNPRPFFNNIKRVFRNMDVALNRTFETAPLIAPVLFVPNTHISMETKAAAYTSMGGAFVSSKIKLAGVGEPADRIYICRNLLPTTVTFQVMTLVHELAHYVSGQPIAIIDIVKKGDMLNTGDRHSFDVIRPEDKVRSAEHYAFFALTSRFPQFI
jgi:peptidoglycan hydrolase-like protein with peptidoglycan-binding domain